MRIPTLTLLSTLAAVLPSIVQAALPQVPWETKDPPRMPWRKPHHPPHHPFPAPKVPNPYDIFVDHFDQHRDNTGTYMQDHLKRLYPNQTIIVTLDPRFDLLSFANLQSEHPVLVREEEDIDALKRIFYSNPSRRRDGPGGLVEAAVFAAYRVAWQDQELLAVVGTWQEGFGYATQWHLIVDKPAVAYSLLNACMAWASELREAVLVFDQGYARADHELYKAIQKASWDDVVLEDAFKKSIQNDYRSFFKSEETYKRLGVPWKRGLIFLGPPGNGKTITLKAIMKEVKTPLIYVKSLHSYMGDEMSIRSLFNLARQQAPCVVVLEDLDSLINDGNRAFFLNEMDGIEDNDGLLLIGTTNHIDRIDPALSSRPSRFDRKYNFPNPSKSERRDYAVYWQKKLASTPEIDFPDSLLDDFTDKTDKFSFAYMKEAFIASLLIIAGKDPKDEIAFPQLLLEQVDKLREDLEKGQDVVAQALPVTPGPEDQFLEPEHWKMGVHVAL